MKRLLIILTAGILISSCGDSTAPKQMEDVAKGAPAKGDIITQFNDLDIKPRFGGCDDIVDPAELKSCADKKMAKFISSNLQYPEQAKKLKVEGKAIVSFVVEPNGSLSEIMAETNLGSGLEEEAIRVMKLMNEQKQWWVAGMKDGKYQRVQLKLPINFKI